MTNHWIDIQNSDVILIMGSNPAANHPIAFKWITKAMEKGAKVICVDPRFTQSAAKAHLYAPLRSGTDIAFLGGMIKYIFDNKLYFEEYVKRYTNATFLVNPDFKLPGDNKGVFSGLVGTKYDKATWSYQTDAAGVIKKDPTMTDPNCVFRLLKKHYSRYTMEMVNKITGTPIAKLEEVYKLYGSTGKPDKSGNELYAMGWTQHTVGVQNIRTMAIIQLLLGNMGIAGGGVAAMRGESNVQGSTDQGLLFHIWPGYVASPKASETTLAIFNEKRTPKTKDPMSVNWWSNLPKYSVSYLKSLFGDAATAENEFGYGWMPKCDDGKSYTWLDLFDAMYQGQFTGFFAWGQNPACSGANSNKTREAMTKLDWMVNINLFDNETGSFWKGPGMDPKKIKTEVFMLPCAASMEKEGSISNSGRWMQWRYKASHPPGDAKPDGDILYDLFRKVQALYKKNKGAFPEPILNLKWDYETTGHFDIHNVAKEINGYDLTTGKLLPNFVGLKDDGTTSCGSSIYSGSYTEAGNMAPRRKRSDPTGLGLYPEWSWCW